MDSLVAIDPRGHSKLRALFKDYRWNYIADAVLEGEVGQARVDDPQQPRVAVLELPNAGLTILGGDPKSPAARAYLAKIPPFSAFIRAAEGWEAALQAARPGKVVRLPRYAFFNHSLDSAHLLTLQARVAPGYRIRQMDLALVRQLAQEKSAFSADHLYNFASAADFLARGFGFCALDGTGEIVCAATTFVVCRRGIEIQINTRAAHQRKGLAAAAAAHLILHSLANGLDPNWDAANETSAALARKLGYTPQGSYQMYYVRD